jgi:tetratricopeptide (TPR) repeat protein
MTIPAATSARNGVLGAMARRLAALFGAREPAQPIPLAQLKRETQGLHRLFPDNPEYLAALAAQLFVRGHGSQAQECLREAERHGYDADQAAVLLARYHVGRNANDEALEILKPILASGKARPDAYEVAAVAYFNLKNIPEAYVHFREAVRLAPHNPIVRASFAGVLEHYSRFEEALVEAKRALRYDPRSPTTLKNLSIAYGALSRFDEEEQILNLGLEYYPGDAELELQLGFVKLRSGDHSAGWPLYEARLRTHEVVPRVRPTTLRRPQWDGKPFQGKTLLLFCEQGYGDNIMMARFFPEVKALGGRVVLEVQPALSGLLSRVPGPDAVVPLDGFKEPAEPYDMWISTMSLPYVLGVDPKRRTAPRRYLEPAAESVAYWRERTASFPGRKVGLAWSGNPSHKNDPWRSIPLDLMRQIIALPKNSFFSLQLAPGWGPDRPQPPGLVDFTDELLTFDDTAGLTECMDLVITVDTSVAHVSGALGKPTWLLVPHLAEWRWGLSGEESAWYPSARVLRQPGRGDWRGLLRQVADRLASA